MAKQTLKGARVPRGKVRSTRFSDEESGLADKLAAQYGASYADWSREAILKWRPGPNDLKRKR